MEYSSVMMKTCLNQRVTMNLATEGWPGDDGVAKLA